MNIWKWRWCCLVIEPQLFVRLFPRGLLCTAAGAVGESPWELFIHSAHSHRKRTENVGSKHSLCDFRPVIAGLLIRQSITDHIWRTLRGEQQRIHGI